MMGFQYRRRVSTGRNTWLNLTKTGVSASARLGRVTLSSRGRGSVRIMKGLSFRFGGRQ